MQVATVISAVHYWAAEAAAAAGSCCFLGCEEPAGECWAHCLDAAGAVALSLILVYSYSSGMSMSLHLWINGVDLVASLEFWGAAAAFKS